MSVGDWLEGREVCVCAGSGGVGKTTTAAAVAAGMAARGKRVGVLTIDPARRLATSLGLPELGNEEHRVEGADGELWAMTLDAKRTFDDLIDRHAPDAARRDAVLANPIYQQLSKAVAGSQEYMAMEKLYELHREGRYDLLVLDTPPTRHALDFLDAPRRLTRFIDSRSLQLFTAPSRIGLRVLGKGTAVAFSVLRRATGIDVLHDLSDFFATFGDMVDGFRERARHVEALIADPATTFMLVTSPRVDAIDDAVYFHDRLAAQGLGFGGVVVNRIHEAPPAGDPSGELRGLLDDDLARRVAHNLDDYRALAERDAANVAVLRERLDDTPMVTVPHLDEDVYDLPALSRLGSHLF